MTVSDGDVLRATGSLDLGRGTVMQNVFHYLYSGTGDTDAAVGAAILLDLTQIFTNMEGEYDQLVASEDVEVWLWDTVLKQFDGIYQNAWTDILGTVVGNMLPNGAAFLVKTLTNKPRRQGRKFLSGISNSKYTDTGFVASVVAAGGLFIGDQFDNPPTANGSLAMGLFNTVSESFIAFKNSGIVNVFCNYQRRRRPGVGI